MQVNNNQVPRLGDTEGAAQTDEYLRITMRFCLSSRVNAAQRIVDIVSRQSNQDARNMHMQALAGDAGKVLLRTCVTCV